MDRTAAAREFLIERAKAWYLERYPRRWAVHREALDMADFALLIASEQPALDVREERLRIAKAFMQVEARDLGFDEFGEATVTWINAEFANELADLHECEFTDGMCYGCGETQKELENKNAG